MNITDKTLLNQYKKPLSHKWFFVFDSQMATGILYLQGGWIILSTTSGTSPDNYPIHSVLLGFIP
ncbi:hypothetical protein C5470_07210 [Photorhabdus stackebrandtii]|uniref:Uncharacterized protein n=1 Tax=Photorhabdus stackebrandtii TaxID=1123042 RepID=A0A7X5QL64_9GAMM|nr:hypothetical protein [Photorhabdus stackebrandtii]